MSAILVLVDDSLDEHLLVRRALRGIEHVQLVATTSGAEALEHLLDPSNATPGLVLLDLKMPGLNGHEVLRILRSHDSLSRVPVVIFSSSSQQSDIDEAQSAGANDYVQKPVDYLEYVQSVRDIVAKWMDTNALSVGQTQ